MTVIYVDTLFLLNGTVDYLLLLAAAKVAGEPLRRLRFAAGAVLGGLYAVVIFLPGFGFLAHPLCRLSAAVLMALAAFGGCRRFFRQLLIFFALSCAFAGGVLAISLLGGGGLALGRGVLYTGMDLKIVLLSAAGCYLALTLLFRKWGAHSHAGGELLEATAHLEGRQAVFSVLVDTGNTLSDPITGRPVLVAEEEVLRPLFPPKVRLTPRELADPAGALERLEGTALAGRMRLLPYRSVGVSAGLLLAVRTDELQAGGQAWEGLLIALSPTPVSEGGAYRALAGAWIGKD